MVKVGWGGVGDEKRRTGCGVREGGGKWYE